MAKAKILRDAKFEELGETRVDTKRRISLGKIFNRKVTSVRIYSNAHGQLILEPMVSIPAHATWRLKPTRARRDATRSRHR